MICFASVARRITRPSPPPRSGSTGNPLGKLSLHMGPPGEWSLSLLALATTFAHRSAAALPGFWSPAGRKRTGACVSSPYSG